MASFRDRLERDLRRISPPDLTYDDLWRRRDRRRRNERIRIAVAALVIAAIGVLAPLRLLGGFGGQTPRPTVRIDRSTVGDLGLRWTLPVGGPNLAASGRVAVVVDPAGSVLALEAASGDRLWRADAAGVIRVAASEETAFAATSAGELLAFEIGCREDGGPCLPDWRARLDGASITALTPAGGLVLISSTEGLAAFEVPCTTSPCVPTWTAPVAGGVTSAPIVVGDTAAVASVDGTLYAFDVACARGGAVCGPVWTVGPDQGRAFVSVAAGVDVVYAGATDGNVYILPSACRDDGGSCEPSLHGMVGGPDAIHALAVVGSELLAAPSPGGILAFPAVCEPAPCEPLWAVPTGRPLITAPVASGGLAFAVTVDGILLALDPACPDPCRPLWSTRTGLDTAALAVTPWAAIVADGNAALAYAVEPDRPVDPS